MNILLLVFCIIFPQCTSCYGPLFMGEASNPGSILKGKNLLLEVQILFFKSLRREVRTNKDEHTGYDISASLFRTQKEITS